MRDTYLQELRCVRCGRPFDPAGAVHTCPSCGPLNGTLDLLYDIAALKPRITPERLRARSDSTLWRYAELLPVAAPDPRPAPPIAVTPLYRPRCDWGFAVPDRLWIKDDARQPSGSSKDRASLIAVVHARQVGARAVAAASTGNAAASLAALAAGANLPAYIFAPSSAPAGKLMQIRMHGAHLFAVDGSYDQAFDLCAEVCARLGFYNRNTASNPYLGEGKKTLALEIWEQLGYRAPDAVLVPVGDGCILGGVHKGFRDLCDLGLLAAPVRLIGVQAAGSSALADAWRDARPACRPVAPHTVADSLAVGTPRDQIKALRAVRETNGAFVTVTDEEILEAQTLLATRAGLWAEPAAAATLAGLRRAMEEAVLAPEHEVVLILTGHGLKDPAAAERTLRPERLHHVEPDLDRVLALIQS